MEVLFSNWIWHKALCVTELMALKEQCPLPPLGKLCVPLGPTSACLWSTMRFPAAVGCDVLAVICAGCNQCCLAAISAGWECFAEPIVASFSDIPSRKSVSSLANTLKSENSPIHRFDGIAHHLAPSVNLPFFLLYGSRLNPPVVLSKAVRNAGR